MLKSLCSDTPRPCQTLPNNFSILAAKNPVLSVEHRNAKKLRPYYTPKELLPAFLGTEFGKGFTANGFGNWFQSSATLLAHRGSRGRVALTKERETRLAAIRDQQDDAFSSRKQMAQSRTVRPIANSNRVKSALDANAIAKPKEQVVLFVPHVQVRLADGA